MKCRFPSKYSGNQHSVSGVKGGGGGRGEGRATRKVIGTVTMSTDSPQAFQCNCSIFPSATVGCSRCVQIEQGVPGAGGPERVFFVAVFYFAVPSACASSQARDGTHDTAVTQAPAVATPDP